jgi:hypothetical protein
MNKRPRLSIYDQEVVRHSYEAFHNIYPIISDALDRISTDLPKAVESHKASLESLEKSESTGFYGAPVEEIKRAKKNPKGKQDHTH